MSVITELDLLAYKGISAKEEIVIKEFVSQCKVININNNIKLETIREKKSL